MNAQPSRGVHPSIHSASNAVFQLERAPPVASIESYGFLCLFFDIPNFGPVWSNLRNSPQQGLASKYWLIPQEFRRYVLPAAA